MAQSSIDRAVRIFGRLRATLAISKQDIRDGMEIVLECGLCPVPSRGAAIAQTESHIIFCGKGVSAQEYGQACGWMAKILISEGIEAFFDAVNRLYDAAGIKEKPTVHYIQALRLVEWYRVGLVNDNEIEAGIDIATGALGNFLSDTAGADEDPEWVAGVRRQYHQEIKDKARALLDRHSNRDIPRDSSGVFAETLVHLFEAGVEASRTADIGPLIRLIRGAVDEDKTQTGQSLPLNLALLVIDTENWRATARRDPLQDGVLVITTANHQEYRLTVSAITRSEIS